MIQNGKREKKIFYSFHKERESIRKKRVPKKSKIIFETIYGWKHNYELENLNAKLETFMLSWKRESNLFYVSNSTSSFSN